MPIRAYFLFITPALAAFLWWASWYLQPEPPKVYQTAAASRTAAQVGKPGSATTGVAPAQAAGLPAASAPEPQASDIKLVASTAVEETKPVVQTPKPKKRKIARRKPPETQAPAYAYGGGNPYGASGYYAGYQQQPFGFGRW